MRYLALGDSYTIGELVATEDNFPNQIKKILSTATKPISELKLIATTGWKTFDLVRAMEVEELQNDWDYVTVLIGVNNQYNHRPLQEYKNHFTYILDRALYFVNGLSHRVFVVSIPDWGCTPFNVDRSKDEVSKEIDQYNKINKQVTEDYRCNYVEITKESRKRATNPEYLASDQLHLSKKEYEIWATLIAEKMRDNAFCPVIS